MSTTIAPPRPATPVAPARGSGRGAEADEPRRFGGDESGDGKPSPVRRYYTGMLVGLGAVTMLFAAFTSAYIVRKGLSDDWIAFPLPHVLWASSLVLLLSSFTIEKARRSEGDLRRFRRWWSATSVLGVGFLTGQLLAWRELTENGVYVATNPAASFFYVLTASHAVHLMGGLAALLLILRRTWAHACGPDSTAVGVTAMYWHFMDGLWIYLWMLLLTWG